MIFNTYQKNQTRNLPTFDSVKNYSSLVNKTRVESLNERIHKANEYINFFVEKTVTENKEKIDKKEELSKPEINSQEITKSNNNNDNLISNNNNTNKSVQVDESNIINNDNKENNLENNNNNEEKKEEGNNNIENNKNIDDENNNLNKIENNNENANIDNKENNEAKINSENNNNNIEEKKEEVQLIEKKEEKITEKEDNVDIPFVKKIKSLLSQLKDLKEKSAIKEEEFNNEINNELPKRSLIEISLSDIKSKRNCELLKNKLTEKEKYIKELESELYNQREENIKLKKSENEYLLKISALEDELRVFKNKFIKYYSQTESNSPHEYGERLVRSMWIRDNIIEDKNNNKNYNNNYDTNSVNSNSNSNMTFNKGNNSKNNRNSFYKNKWNSPWNSQTQRKINNNEFINNNINNNFRYNNGGQSNFQRVSGMILDNNKNRLMNYGNEININRFKNGNY